MKLDTFSARNLGEAQTLLKRETFDLCLTDMRLPDGTGLELVQHIQQRYPQLPVAMITAYGNLETAINALKAGAFDFLTKPVDLACLRELVEETHCALPEAHMRAALQSVAVFDHPDRSQRGRTITHAHYFDLGDAPFPAVRADDDAMQVEWVAVEKLAAMEEEFFEDHFHMLDHFLVLTTPP